MQRTCDVPGESFTRSRGSAPTLRKKQCGRTFSESRSRRNELTSPLVFCRRNDNFRLSGVYRLPFELVDHQRRHAPFRNPPSGQSPCQLRMPLPTRPRILRAVLPPRRTTRRGWQHREIPDLRTGLVPPWPGAREELQQEVSSGKVSESSVAAHLAICSAWSLKPPLPSR